MSQAPSKYNRCSHVTSATHWFWAQRHLVLPRDTADQISAVGTFCTLYSPFVAYVVPIYVVALFGNSWFLSPSRSICFTVHELRGELIRMNLWIRPKAMSNGFFNHVRPRFLHSFKKIQKRCELCSIANSARLWQQGIAPTGTEGNGKTRETPFGHLPDWSFMHFYM